ncbi:MAG: DUF4147 domain-containing protein [Candidatus Paceibacterota bacterium]
MTKKWIKNFDELSITENRKLALEIIEAGLSAISSEEVILNKIKLENNILSVMGQNFDLQKFKKIKVVGFGKAVGGAALALEKVLGDKVDSGAIVGLDKSPCKNIETFIGTHPKPSEINILAGKRIYEIVKDSNEDDLIIVLVSGGGSALLSFPDSEVEQGKKLYENALKSGQTINETNTIRKHLSLLKGGGLVKLAYPATVIGIIFSDVPGDNFKEVASGSTYKDDTTIDDAQKIINKYNLGKYELIETPKDDKYFEKVYNFVLVSNKTAVEAMSEKVIELGMVPNIISTELYDEVDNTLKKICDAKKENTVVLAAGEPRLIVTKQGGSGGRSLFMGLRASKLKIIDEDSVLIPLASDGRDNSDAAGVIVDKNTYKHIEESNINIDEYLESFDVYPVFKKSGDMIITGPTGANVSDLMILLTKK